MVADRGRNPRISCATPSHFTDENHDLSNSVSNLTQSARITPQNAASKPTFSTPRLLTY